MEMGTPTRLPVDSLTGDESLELPEFDSPPADPVALLGDWIAAAMERGVREPLALALATVDARGIPASRTVLITHMDGRGLLFTTSYASRKARQIAATGRAAGTLYWRETMQQVNVAGPIERLTEGEAAALFADRPATAQAAAVVSRQSEALADEQALHRAAGELLASNARIERPDDYGGYRLVLERIEFFHGSASRLHRRLEYTRAADGWAWARLQP
jgi:dihydrophenazinedicarboxylate synthase